MTSSSTSTTLSDKQCNESWSEQIEAEEVEAMNRLLAHVAVEPRPENLLDICIPKVS